MYSVLRTLSPTPQSRSVTAWAEGLVLIWIFRYSWHGWSDWPFTPDSYLTKQLDPCSARRPRGLMLDLGRLAHGIDQCARLQQHLDCSTLRLPAPHFISTLLGRTILNYSTLRLPAPLYLTPQLDDSSNLASPHGPSLLPAFRLFQISLSPHFSKKRISNSM